MRQEDVWAWGERASRLIAAGRPAAALPWLRRCASRGAGWALLLRSRAKQSLGQPRLAEADVTRAFDADPACGWIFGLAVGAAAVPPGAAARRLLAENRRFGTDPACYAVRAFIGKLSIMAGRGAAGLAHLDWAVKAAPSRPYLFTWRAEARRRLGDLRGARADARRALALDARSAVAWTTQAALHRTDGRPRRALEAAARACRLSRTYEQAPLEAARACLALGDGRGLLVWLERAVRRSRRLGWRNLADGAASPAPEPESLLDRPELQAAAWRGRLLAWCGERALSRGEAARASLLLAQAARLAPGFSWAHGWLGEACLLLGDAARARGHLSRALSGDGRDARSWIALGRSHLEERRAGQALSTFRRAAELEPDWAWALYWRGRAQAELGRPEAARRDFDAALRFDGRFTEALRARALLTAGP